MSSNPTNTHISNFQMEYEINVFHSIWFASHLREMTHWFKNANGNSLSVRVKTRRRETEKNARPSTVQMYISSWAYIGIVDIKFNYTSTAFAQRDNTQNYLQHDCDWNTWERRERPKMGRLSTAHKTGANADLIQCECWLCVCVCRPNDIISFFAYKFISGPRTKRTITQRNLYHCIDVSIHHILFIALIHPFTPHKHKTLGTENLIWCCFHRCTRTNGRMF